MRDVVFDLQSMYHLGVMTLQGVSSDLLIALVMFALTGLVAAAYSIKVLFKGKSRFDRIDKQGGSALLSKDVMQGGYWFLQPLGRALVFAHVTPNMVSWGSLFFGVL